MSSFFWLLLYLAPLLGITAAVFGWLGWRWQGTDLRKRLQELESRIAEMQSNRSAGEIEHEELRAKARAAEAESSSLRDELNTARNETLRNQNEAAKAQEFSLSLKSELARTIHELDTLRSERDLSAAALVTAQDEIERLRSLPPVATASPPAPLPEPPPPERTKRTRSTTTKARTTAPRNATLHDTLANVEAQLTTHQATVTALTQERDDWHRRVTKLESQTIADPAGLGLAYRSLADSEKRLQAVNTNISLLQNQSRVLRRVQENAAALASLPSDDLTRIKGIKSVISEQLRAHGIHTWRQIAQWDDEELRVFSELLAFKNRATREKWKEQAQALHESVHNNLL